MKHSKKIFSAVLITMLWLGGVQLYAQKDGDRAMYKLGSAMQVIKYAYVDSVDQSDLVEKMIASTLKELDPHSQYFTKDEIKEADEPLQGKFEGIGVQFQLFKDTILVVAVIPGGPSEEVGLMAGDRIVTIDGEDATGEKLNNKYVRDHLRGDKGTKVIVGIKRGMRKELLDFTITRDKIPINSIDATYMVDQGVGYVKLNRFSQTSMTEFKESIKQLEKEGMKSLILDLRGNTGGYLKTAVELSDQFIDGRKLLVYTEGNNSPKQSFNAREKGNFEKGMLVVMINEGSASASEIVSGAVQDWDRGLIVGRRSFGKGLVQRPFQLPDSSVIRLTTARYYTPSGRCIQKSYENGAEDYYKDFSNRVKHGELQNVDSIHMTDSIKYFTANGRIVHGGGGVMPDVFVPWDSTRFSDYYTDLIRKNVFNDWVMNILEKNRKSYVKQYPTLDVFKNEYSITEKMMEDFMAFAKEKGVDKDEKGLETSGAYIQLVLKALMARNIFDINAYFEVISELDNELQEAVRLIKEGNKFEELSLR
ncbi:MAG: S41 family peptidase [Bacteroidales bacterium]|nr:S41 family peptidase [Bacteroidales bacterium]